MNTLLADLRDLRPVLGLMRIRRWMVARAIALGSLTLGASVALSGVSAWLIVRASQMPPVMFLNVAAVGVRFFGILRGVSRYLERLASHDVALEGVVNLRTTLYERLATGRTERIAALRRGDLLARTGVDVDDVGDVVVRGIVPAAVAVVVSLGSVVAIAFFNPLSALILLVMLAISALVVPVLAARADTEAEQARVAERTAVGTSTETLITRAAELALSGRTEAELAALEAAHRRSAAVENRAARPLAASAAIAVLTTGLAVLGALLVAIPAHVSGTLTATELGVVVLLPLAAFEATAALPAAASQVHRSAAAARRIADLLGPEGMASASPPAAEADAGSQAAPSGTGSQPGPHEAGLRADALRYGWPGHATLGEVSLEVTPGRSLAIVGPSGVGKTTLLLTLAGMLPAAGGSVRLDGLDPYDLRGAERTRHVALTAEDAHVFTTSVLENLRAARGDVTEEEAWDALRRAGLSEWVSSLPAGLDEPIGPETVSGGERRRLLIARALISRAPLLLLDEPAEHLSAEVAHQLMTDLLGLVSEGLTVVVVTHHTSALEHADDVLTLSTGAAGAHVTDPTLETT